MKYYLVWFFVVGCLSYTAHGQSLSSAEADLFSKVPNPVTDEDFQDNGSPSAGKVELGNLLYFDKILSGNRNISCATCHHPFASTSDGLSLGVGEGGQGVSTTRNTGDGEDGIHERVPRNAPAIFNIGAKEYDVMFHDGRVAVDPEQQSGFFSPAGDDLPKGLENVLAAQAMFPVTSATEMAGQEGENPIADAAVSGRLAGSGGVWDLLAKRLREIPEYVELFIEVFPDVNEASDIDYVHAANAISAFQAHRWRADNSPFDQFLRGDLEALNNKEYRGMFLFYGKAKCSDCHSGKFQTDHSFHSIAMPQFGPGKGDGFNGREDYGRGRVTGLDSDQFKFRTPSLRNTTLTGPWGHSGAYASLEAVVRHHLAHRESLKNYDRSQVVMPDRVDLNALDFFVMDQPVLIEAIANSGTLPDVKLHEREIEYLVAFLHSLTDRGSIDRRIDVPREVPSGLTIFD